MDLWNSDGSRWMMISHRSTGMQAEGWVAQAEVSSRRTPDSAFLVTLRGKISKSDFLARSDCHMWRCPWNHLRGSSWTSDSACSSRFCAFVRFEIVLPSRPVSSFWLWSCHRVGCPLGSGHLLREWSIVHLTQIDFRACWMWAWIDEVEQVRELERWRDYFSLRGLSIVCQCGVWECNARSRLWLRWKQMNLTFFVKCILSTRGYLMHASVWLCFFEIFFWRRESFPWTRLRYVFRPSVFLFLMCFLGGRWPSPTWVSGVFVCDMVMVSSRFWWHIIII